MEMQRTATDEVTDKYDTEWTQTDTKRTPNGCITNATVHSVRWKGLNMLKTFHRTEWRSTDITGQVTYSLDELLMTNVRVTDAN